MTPLALRLTPGTDVKQALTQLAQKHQLQASCILSGIGSLTQAQLQLSIESYPIQC